eukprot:TRINITY_DN1326_c0_g1_i5.p5 TRINITY_DN1326_c0_g1~~TRINITY_DN1326_c0_g1_i5.p5  ORF type:complete len:145 (+),score=3.67 TRINITY_DN1326_c0_g1_i5:771-1205(+)
MEFGVFLYTCMCKPSNMQKTNTHREVLQEKRTEKVDKNLQLQLFTNEYDTQFFKKLLLLQNLSEYETQLQQITTVAKSQIYIDNYETTKFYKITTSEYKMALSAQGTQEASKPVQVPRWSLIGVGAQTGKQGTNIVTEVSPDNS